MFYPRLFVKFVKIRWRSQLEYPMAYFLGIVAQWTGYGFQFAVMWIMVNAFGLLGSWQPMEVLFLYAMNLFSYALGAAFTFNIAQSLPEMVRTGSFDDVLIKPVHSLVYLLSANINVGYVSHFTLAVAAMAVSFKTLGLLMTPMKALWLVAALLGGALIHGSFILLTTLPSLFIVSENHWGFLYWGLKDILDYPLAIFGRPVQLLFTFVLPYSFINFYPAQPLLEKSDLLLFPPFIQYMTPLVGLVLACLTALAWWKAAQKYESTGS